MVMKVMQVPDKILKIAHLTGLGFKEGDSVTISREGDDLVFSGKVEKEFSKSFFIELEDKTIKLAIKDFESIDIFDESSRTLGKAALGGTIGGLVLGPIGMLGGSLLGAREKYKSFIIIQIKPEDRPAYQIVLGGENRTEVRKKYDSLLKLTQNEPT